MIAATQWHPKPSHNTMNSCDEEKRISLTRRMLYVFSVTGKLLSVYFGLQSSTTTNIAMLYSDIDKTTLLGAVKELSSPFSVVIELCLSIQTLQDWETGLSCSPPSIIINTPVKAFWICTKWWFLHILIGHKQLWSSMFLIWNECVSVE